MSKITKEQQARLDGMRYALKVAKEQGVEELERDIKFRTNTNMPISVPRKEAIQAIENIKFQTLDTVLTCSLLCLRDVDGWGATRLNRFVEKFNEYAQLLASNECDWQDIIDVLKEEVNLDLTIRYNNDNIQI